MFILMVTLCEGACVNTLFHINNEIHDLVNTALIKALCTFSFQNKTTMLTLFRTLLKENYDLNSVQVHKSLSNNGHRCYGKFHKFQEVCLHGNKASERH